MDHREYWRGLCPQLHVEGNLDRAEHRFDRLDELLGDLRVEGYVHVPDVLPPEVVGPLRDCIQLLHTAGIPLPFAFVYDEFWLIWQRLSQFISAAPGGRLPGVARFLGLVRASDGSGSRLGPAPRPGAAHARARQLAAFAHGLAAGPRISVAYEFQRADRPAFNQPLLDPHRLPTFTERLGLIGKQVLQYRHMEPLAPDVEAIAVDLRDRFMPEVFAPAAPS